MKEAFLEFKQLGAYAFVYILLKLAVSQPFVCAALSAAWVRNKVQYFVSTVSVNSA